jgi:hypothetical protein
VKYRDRILGTVRVRGDRLLPHPKNWRVHPENQRDAMRGVLADLGVARSLTGVPANPKALAEVRAMETQVERDAWLRRFEAGAGDILLLDGHLRAEEIRDQPLPVELLDLDEREQAELLATFDPIGDLATADRAKFVDLANDFNSTNPAVQALVADLAALKVGGAAAEFGLEGDGATGGGEDGYGDGTGENPPEDEEEPVIPTDALIEKWGTAPGQLWVVPSLTVPGREHRLLCGDCRDPANVARLRNGRRPRLGLHDPPYGVNAVDTTRQTLSDGRKVAKTRSSSKSFEPVHEDDRQFSPAHLLGSSDRVVLWGANNFAHLLPPSAEWVMWSKRTGMAESTFSDGELAWVSPKAQGVGHVRGIWHTWSGANRASETEEESLHPTQKPVKVQRAPIEWYTEPGNDVEDWYMGAGAVIIACEQSGRIGHGMDIAHAYLAATLERLSQRGLTPRLVT